SFTRAIRPHKGIGFSAIELQIHSFQHFQFAKRFLYVPDLYHSCHWLTFIKGLLSTKLMGVSDGVTFSASSSISMKRLLISTMAVGTCSSIEENSRTGL